MRFDPIHMLSGLNWREVLLTALILAAAWLAARLCLMLVGVAGRRWAALTASRLDDHLLEAVRGPLGWLVFLLGLYLAMHRYHFGLLHALDGVLYVATVAVCTLMLIRVQGALVRWYGERSRDHLHDDTVARDVLPMAERLGRVLIVLVGALVVLDHFHIEIRSILVTLGVGSLAIGLALQDTLANMIGGFIILVDRPFRVGDRIQLETLEVGDVQEIGIRATRIVRLEGNLLIVPNSVLVRTRVVNLSLPDASAPVMAEVRVAHGTDLAGAKAVLLRAAGSVESLLKDPAPAVFFLGFDEAALRIRVAARTANYRDAFRLTAALNEAVLRALEEAGIEKPPVTVAQTRPNP